MSEELEHYECYPNDEEGIPVEPPETIGSADNSETGAVHRKAAIAIPRERVTKSHPLKAFTLRGDAAKLEARAVDTKPLLGEFVMRGQATMIYAQPNAGKTLTVLGLLLKAIEAENIDPDKVYYVNADDDSKGLSLKVRLLEEAGAHMLAPGYKGFKANQFVDKLIHAAEDGSARDTVVIIDTVKKFTNLMDKGRSSEFGQVCRECVTVGGTIVGLGHTAKSANADGTPRYQGTTDILEDFDAVYVAELMSSTPGSSEKIIRFTRLKSRADSPEVVAYAYSTAPGYEDKLASLRPVYPEELDGHDTEFELDDNGVIETLLRVIAGGHGDEGIDKIVRVAAVNGDVSRASARRVLDRYNGNDPSKHLWTYDKGDRGKRTYRLLDRPS